MTYAIIAEREIRQGDRITALVVEATARDGFRQVWSGEFSATVGDGKLGQFAAGCDRDATSAIYAHLTDGTIAMAMPWHISPKW
jgi:hypothetical protein